jgi:tetratricopeptide (TPR) repeat protein
VLRCGIAAVAALDRCGYARLVGGPDEARARAVLTAMQDRLAEGPFAALGIPSTATATEIRAAFLQLTKTYHPARFGYMAPELQRLANEVFLSLRAAHDSIAKPTRGWASRPDRSGTYQKDRSGVFPKHDRSGVFPAVDRSATPPLGTRVVAPRASTSTPPQPATAVRQTGGRPAVAAPGAAARPEERELASALEQMQRRQWDAARATLAALAARAPDVPRYRALICYARGREAQLAHRLDEARVELQDALQLDPDLQLAKTALAELFTRRK